MKPVRTGKLMQVLGVLEEQVSEGMGMILEILDGGFGVLNSSYGETPKVIKVGSK